MFDIILRVGLRTVALSIRIVTLIVIVRNGSKADIGLAAEGTRFDGPYSPFRGYPSGRAACFMPQPPGKIVDTNRFLGE